MGNSSLLNPKWVFFENFVAFSKYMNFTREDFSSINEVQQQIYSIDSIESID